MKSEGKKHITHIVGIDEAGRGPLAGPVAVGVAYVPFDFDWELLPGVGDSKKVAAKNREAVFRRAHTLRHATTIDFSVTLVSAAIIDRIGITRAVAQGIAASLEKLNLNPASVDIRLDGLLKAPPEYPHQETIIKGDAKEKVIGLASILAKVTRDRHMEMLSKKHPAYDFHIHKGYGTKAHREAILKNGLSTIHRASFCKKYTDYEHAG